ncbi:phage head-tail adaptor, putative, SPP1 family [Collimonas sp. OK607]|uniref:phage head closure protein n=1 Tax=Collimonas sp. OK607 TaxID=1798194 RepID=UPI0008E56A0F|nr:phage head closure protein [Collimonas sp. OK607]SFB02736.1 phage head-tail adaptor, putative, SPP1 family [Collimonas sp. OK607]
MTSVRAGQLSRRLRIQSRSSVQDSFGQQQLIWTDLITVWADIQPLAGRELESAQRMVSEVSHQIIVRFQPLFSDTRVVAEYRALYKGRIFNIQACMNEDERNAVVTLLASEGLNDG